MKEKENNDTVSFIHLIFNKLSRSIEHIKMLRLQLCSEHFLPKLNYVY